MAKTKIVTGKIPPLVREVITDRMRSLELWTTTHGPHMFGGGEIQERIAKRDWRTEYAELAAFVGLAVPTSMQGGGK